MATGIYPQYMHSKQLGAPQMTGNVGSEGQILQVLDACLLTGFNTQQVLSMESSGSNVKINFGSSHGFVKSQFVIISGANTVSLNGKFRVLSVVGNSITVSAQATSNYTGSVTVKVAPIGGWESIFGSSQPLKRAYRSLDPTSTKTVLYLDCVLKSALYNSTNPPKFAKLTVCEDMEVLGQPIGEYTTENSKYEDGAYQWLQGHAARFTDNDTTGAESDWAVFGDGKFFYFFVSSSHAIVNPLGNKTAYFFGDLPRQTGSDIFNCVFACNDFKLPNDRFNYLRQGAGGMTYSMTITNEPLFYIKPITGIGGLEQMRRYGHINSGSGGSSVLFEKNDPLTLGLYFTDILLGRPVTNSFGGILPYLRYVMNDLTSYEFSLDYLIFGDHLLVACGNASSSRTYGYFALDLESERPEDK